MKLNLISCDAPKPDKRALKKMFEEIAMGMDSSLAFEMTEILLDGDPVEIEVSEKTTSSAYRSLRKLSIDYEIIED